MKSASERFGLPSAIDFLLTQHVEAQQLAGPVFVGEHDDVVIFRGRRPESVHATGLEQALADDAVEQCAPVVIEFAGGLAILRVIENRREASLQLPC